MQYSPPLDLKDEQVWYEVEHSLFKFLIVLNDLKLSAALDEMLGLPIDDNIYPFLQRQRVKMMGPPKRITRELFLEP